MNDWTGNKKSAFTTIGATGHSETTRETNDFYATRPSDVMKFLGVYKEVPHKVWECSCGTGNISDVLLSLGHDVISTDLIDRGYGQGGVDFLQTTEMPDGCDCIMTNPPYKYATDFVEHGLSLLPDNGKLIMLFKTTFLEGINRYNRIFSKTPPLWVYQYACRAACALNNEFDKYSVRAVSYAWFIWVKGYYPQTCIKWIV